MNVFKSKMMASSTALTLSLSFAGLWSLTGCYIERDVTTLKPWRAQAEQKTISVEIPFSSVNAEINRNSHQQIKDAIDRTVLSTNNNVYARVKVRHLQQNPKDAIQDSMQDPRIKKTLKLLKQYGIDSQRIDVAQDEALKISSYDPKTSVWIGIDAYDIMPIKCPGFDGQIMNGRLPPEGETHFGCTTEKNFAAMVAEPKDLHHGHDLAGSNSELLSKAIERLKTDKVKNLKIEKIDSVGAATGG